MYFSSGWLPTEVPEAIVPVTACDLTGIDTAPAAVETETVNSWPPTVILLSFLRSAVVAVVGIEVMVPDTSAVVLPTDVSVSSLMSGTSGTRCELAVTEVAPAASSEVLWPALSESTNASVVMSGKTLTMIEPPIAEPPMARAPATARLLLPSALVALTVMAPPLDSTEPLPTDASVWNFTTRTPIDAETLACDRPPAAEMPQLMKSFLEGATASTVMSPVAVRCAPELTDAVLLASVKMKPSAAATLASLLDWQQSMDVPVAFPLALLYFFAPTLLSPPLATPV